MPPVLHGLRRIRRAADLSQTELARQVGTTRQVIADLETSRSIPKLPLARRLARALDVGLDDLFPPADGTGAVA